MEFTFDSLLRICYYEDVEAAENNYVFNDIPKKDTLKIYDMPSDYD